MTKRPAKNPAAVYLSKWPEGSDTRKTMRQALDRVAGVLEEGADAESFAWHELRYEDARAIAAAIAEEELAPATINKCLSAVRGVLKTAYEMRLISEDEYLRINIEDVRGNSEEAGRALEPEEREAIVAKLPQLPPQEAAAVAVMLGAGARVVEVVKVLRDHFDPTSNRITLLGKGGKPRKVPLGPTWRAPLEAWRSAFSTNDRLFEMSRRQAGYIVRRLSAALGGRPFTPHDLRRSFATYVCETADVAIAQRLLGHSDIKTTLLYDRRGEAAEDDAVKDW